MVWVGHLWPKWVGHLSLNGWSIYGLMGRAFIINGWGIMVWVGHLWPKWLFSPIFRMGLGTRLEQKVVLHVTIASVTSS